ncbi:peptidase S41 family protein [Histoplasma ohiense]|nr:peptidase S41 family protein [Histoplasma ohiense (nom. inval.)]
MKALGHIFTSLSLLAVASVGFGQPSSDAVTLEKRAVEPCKKVADAYDEQSAEDSEGPFFVSAQLAHDCLVSIPINRGDALRLVDGLTSFWKWQSTIDFLKDPPSGYLLPASDLVGELAKIRRKVSKGKYKNEYDFQSDLSALARTTHDGHFNLQLDAANVFRFRRSRAGPIVSVSKDGKGLPKIYSFYDLNITDPKFTPSPIEEIDGEDATEWLRKLSYEGSYQDPDALYNDLFWSIPTDANGGYGGFYGQIGVYTGPSITFKFENGTVNKYENRASFSAPFTDVVDGKSFYEKFCSSKLGLPFKKSRRDDIWKDAPMNPGVAPRASENSRPLYPNPVIDQAGGDIGGYFLDGDHGDVAVLSASSFKGSGAQGSVAFQETIEKFLSECKKAGKKKLIVDVTGNGGGTILLGYDMFKQLIPNGKVDDAFNIRAHEQLDIIGEKVQNMLNDGKETSGDRNERDGLYDLDSYVNLDNKKFKSWDDFYGPVQVDGFKFSHPARWDLNNEDTSRRGSGGIVVTGYLSRANAFNEVFKLDDIVLLTDGTCGSTCALFANLMQKAGVRTIAVGGLPREGPMQAVGGVKGAQVLTYQRIYETASMVFDLYASPQEKRKWAGTDLGDIYRTGKYILARTVRDGEGARINYRNAIDPKDEKRIPLQFVYLAAGCRIWQTRDMVFDITKLWIAAADRAFGGGACIPGSTPQPSKHKGDGSLFRPFSTGS